MLVRPPVMQDYVLNGRAHGPFAQFLEQRVRFEPGLMKPFIEDDPSHPMRGKRCVIANSGLLDGVKKYKEVTVNGMKQRAPVLQQYLIDHLERKNIYSPVFNSTSMRKEEWIVLDQRLIRAARLRLRAYADLAAKNTFGGFNAMAKAILEHEVMSDPGFATVDMSGVSEAPTNDAALFTLQGLPLVITHSDFEITQRDELISENTGTSMSTNNGEAAGRRVAEMIEAMTIGTRTGPTYGGNSTQVGGYGRTPSVYGYINFPARLTKTNMTAPTAGGWTPATTINEVLAARDQLFAGRFYGPFMLYHTNDYDQYMDRDYILTGGNVATQTMRRRLREIGKEDTDNGQQGQIDGVRRLDFWFGAAPSGVNAARPDSLYDATLKAFSMLLISMTPEVCRAVSGMDMTTIMWPEKGGLVNKFKVMCIQVPQLFADYYGNCGILHATTS